MFQLACRLGITAGELQQKMSYVEFKYWQAFSTLEPIGVLREDMLQANIAQTLADIHAPKHGLKLDSFMLFKQKVSKTKAELVANLKSFFGK